MSRLVRNYMLFGGREVRIGKSYARGLSTAEAAGQGPCSRPRAQFFPIRTNLGSIDPCAPLIGDFLAIDFPPLRTANMYFILGSVIGQSKDLSAHAFRSPANQLQVVLLVHALVDQSQLISTHNSVFARLGRLFPLPPSTFISHFYGLPFLGVALYIGAYVLSASFCYII